MSDYFYSLIILIQRSHMTVTRDLMTGLANEENQ